MKADTKDKRFCEHICTIEQFKEGKRDLLNREDARPLPLVSVVIPMRNERKTIEDCIRSVLSQDYPQDKLEIIVVDGMSEDGSHQMVASMAQRSDNIFLFDNPKKSTPRGLNLGIQKSKGSVVIILGAHSLLSPNFISLNTKYLEEKDAQCVGGTTENVGDTYVQRAIGLAMSSPFGILSAPYRYSSRSQYVDTVIYGAYRRELFEELGLFEENGIISEDAEFNWRIRKAGYKIFYTPEIKTFYHPRESIPKLIRQFFKYGILRLNVIKKHMDALKVKHLLPSLVLLSMITLIVLSIWKRIFLLPVVALAGAYLILILIGSVQICLHKGWKYLAVLPLIFLALHVSFAVGFLAGLAKRS